MCSAVTIMQKCSMFIFFATFSAHAGMIADDVGQNEGFARNGILAKVPLVTLNVTNIS